MTGAANSTSAAGVVGPLATGLNNASNPDISSLGSLNAFQNGLQQKKYQLSKDDIQVVSRS